MKIKIIKEIPNQHPEIPIGTILEVSKVGKYESVYANNGCRDYFLYKHEYEVIES